jgi:hypothetical protein
MILNKKLFFYILLICLLNIVSFSQRFNTLSLIVPPDVQLRNIGEFFTYKEEMKTRLENPKMVLYRTSITEQKDLPDKDFLYTMMDTDFFLRNDFERSSYNGLLTNYRPKYENLRSFQPFIRLDVGDVSRVFLLFVNTTLPEQARYYYHLGVTESLKQFYADNIRKHDRHTLFILFADTDYYNFRKICDEVDFVDIIVNFQEFEKGHIYDKKIYNVSRDPFEIGRLDIMFGRHGLLATSWTGVNITEYAPSDFIRSVLSRGGNDEED